MATGDHGNRSCEVPDRHLSIGSSEDDSDSDGDGEYPPATGLTVEQVHVLQMVPRVAELVSSMAITNPEVLRVTRAYQAFQNCAEAFRADKDFHHKSRKSVNISRFWSHSWHGSSWAKVLTLLVLYNGLASVLLGTFAALVMMCLFSLGFLPGFSRGMQGADFPWSTWSIATGLVVSVTSFIVWKPQQEVFFDRLCISEDPELKSHAIFSLAGMLKNSNEMLVLWDPSWSDRLWCLFELAAFLKSKKMEGREKVLIIRPTFVGPCSITAFLAVCAAMLGVTTMPMPLGSGLVFLIPILGLLVFGSVGAFCALMTFRAYFHSVQILEETLRSKTFDSVRSSCCEMNHVDAHGNPMLCDREVAKKCITMWFGSIQAFEESIRSELLDVVTEELRHNVFTRGWVLQVASPILWAFMDIAATHIAIESFEKMVEFSVLGLVMWLLCAPIFVEVLTLLTRRYCGWATCCGGIFSDFILKLALLLTLLLVAVLMCGIFIAIEGLLESSTAWIRAATLFGAFLTLYIITYVLKHFAFRMSRQATKNCTSP